MPTSNSHGSFRFRDFELDLAAYELRRGGHPVKLERRLMELLIMLVERRRQLVSRSDIVDRLWGRDVFVDVETGVNTAISKIRQLLGDSAETPGFIETVSGKGYRFIAPVELVSAQVVESTRAMLAVLPFEDFGSDPERQYLADGLVEETIASIGQIDPERLQVIGRTSSMAYRHTRKTLAEIGHELSADYLLEGSIRGEHGQLRITSRLIRVRDQMQVWSASYDREPTSMMGLQRELSTAIAEQIRLRLSPERLDVLARRHTRNAEAYDLYLRARYLWNQLTPATNKRAVEYYERAIALDPDYALAWAGIANTLLASPINSDMPSLQVIPRAREAAERAVRAEPDLAEVQNALAAFNFLLGWDWPAAEAGFRRAIALDPGNAFGYRMLGHVLSQTGRHSEAWPHMRRACELDPLYAMNYAMLSQVAFQARDYALAVENARQAIIIDPEFWIGHVQLGQVCEQLGKSEQAFEAFANAARFSGGNSKAISLRGYLLAKLGRTDEARELLRTLEGILRERYIPPYSMALLHAGLGERDQVFDWLERAIEAHDVHLIFLTVDPKWDAYRADARFQAVLGRCDFMPQTEVSRVAG